MIFSNVVFYLVTITRSAAILIGGDDNSTPVDVQNLEVQLEHIENEKSNGQVELTNISSSTNLKFSSKIDLESNSSEDEILEEPKNVIDQGHFLEREEQKTGNIGTDQNPEQLSSSQMEETSANIKGNGKIRMLIVDAGGCRAFMTQEILRYCEEQVQKRMGPNAKLIDYVDFLGGSSAGGIISTCMALPDSEESATDSASTASLQKSSNENERGSCKTLSPVKFRSHENPALQGAMQVLSKKNRKSRWSCYGIKQCFSSEPIYDEKVLVNACESITGGAQFFHQLARPVVVTAFDCLNQQVVFFNSRADPEEEKYQTVDVMMSTLAVPIALTPWKMENHADYAIGNVNMLNIDASAALGGNPTYDIYPEVRRIHRENEKFFSYRIGEKDHVDPSDLCILNIGHHGPDTTDLKQIDKMRAPTSIPRLLFLPYYAMTINAANRMEALMKDSDGKYFRIHPTSADPLLSKCNPLSTNKSGIEKCQQMGRRFVGKDRVRDEKLQAYYDNMKKNIDAWLDEILLGEKGLGSAERRERRRRSTLCDLEKRMNKKNIKLQHYNSYNTKNRKRYLFK